MLAVTYLGYVTSSYAGTLLIIDRKNILYNKGECEQNLGFQLVEYRLVRG